MALVVQYFYESGIYRNNRSYSVWDACSGKLRVDFVLSSLLSFSHTSMYPTFFLQKPWSSSYDGSKEKKFKRLYAILPCLALAVVFNESKGLYMIFSNPLSWMFEVCWSFSIFLEAVAVLPQLFLLREHGQVENFTSLYMFSLGMYRALYVMNWVMRYFMEPHYWSPIAWVCGIIQVRVGSQKTQPIFSSHSLSLSSPTLRTSHDTRIIFPHRLPFTLTFCTYFTSAELRQG